MLHGCKASASQLAEDVCPMRKEQGESAEVWWRDYESMGAIRRCSAMSFSFLLFQAENKWHLRLSPSE